jgi:mRNA interferase RelE/StbE
VVKMVTYTKAAARALNRMPRSTALRIRDKVNEYAANPASQANNVKTLKGSSWIRLRVGDWRVIMEDGIVLAVLKIGPRAGVYD